MQPAAATPTDANFVNRFLCHREFLLLKESFVLSVHPMLTDKQTQLEERTGCGAVVEGRPEMLHGPVPGSLART